MTETYFAYSRHSTKAQAERALDRYLANGEICESEHPKIVRDSKAVVGGSIKPWVVAFPG